MQCVLSEGRSRILYYYLEELQDLKGYFNEPNEEQEVETETRRMEGSFRNILPNNMTANVLSSQRQPTSYLTFRKVV
jgi:hypothetical protein